MATISSRVAALEAWKSAHLNGHVLSGHSHTLPAHTHPTTPTPTPTVPPAPTLRATAGNASVALSW